MPDSNEAPCDKCFLAYRCKEQLIACRTFYTYTTTGKFKVTSGKARKPSKKFYKRIFGQKVDK